MLMICRRNWLASLINQRSDDEIATDFALQLRTVARQTRSTSAVQGIYICIHKKQVSCVTFFTVRWLVAAALAVLALQDSDAKPCMTHQTIGL